MKTLEITITEKEYNLIEAILYLHLDYVTSDDVSVYIQKLVERELNTIKT
jgi:hypothetical protein